MNNKETAQKVVDRIVAMIEEGKPLPWVQPWDMKATRPDGTIAFDGWGTDH